MTIFQKEINTETQDPLALVRRSLTENEMEMVTGGVYYDDVYVGPQGPVVQTVGAISRITNGETLDDIINNP